jgi:pilus assembly protein FimV
MPVHALGLGEIDVRSKLNQNFSASIPVIDSAPQELDSLQVVMANPADFDRAGIERADYLASITLKLETGAGGTRVLVSSNKIAHEPFLNFLVEAHWQGGRLLREYTVLLDPPNLPSSQTAAAIAPAAPASAEAAPAPAIATMPEPAAVAEAPTPEAATPALAAPMASAPAQPVAEMSKPAAASQTAPNPKNDKAAATASGADPFASKAATDVGAGAKTYGPVDPTETLWGIAGRVRPEAASTDQTLLALGLANPEAFDHGLFNGLLKGVTLKVPSDAAIESVPPNVAAERIAQWRKGGKLAAESSKTAAATPAEKPAHSAAAKPAEPSAAATPTPSNSGMKPAPASTDSAAKSVKGSTPSPASSSVFPTGPAPAPSVPAPLPSTGPAPAPSAPAATATSAAAPATTGATTSGVSPAPVGTPAAASTTPVAAPAPASVSTAAAPESPVVAAAAVSNTGGNVAGATSGSAAPSVAAPVAAPAQAASSGGSSAWLWILLLLAALIGFLVFRSKRAKKPVAEAPPPMSPPIKLSSLTPPAPKSAAPPLQNSPAAVTNSESNRAQSAGPAVVKAPVETRPFSAADPVFEPIAEVAPAKSAPASSPAKIDSPIGASDPLSEADFHLAYGLHDEAANLLRRGIESDPTRKDLRVKLAEVYFAARKAAEFQQTAVPLRGQIAAGDWQKLAALGRQITPDVAAFRDDADAAEIASPRAASPAPSAPTSAPPPSNPPSNLLEFNFDEPAKPAPSAAPPAKSSNLLDFDFDAELASLQPTSLNKSMASAPDLSPHEFDLSQEMQELQDSKPAVSPPAADTSPSGEVDLSQSFPESPSSAGDEIGTKLDLARAYADMGDNEAATELLREVALAGNTAQMQEAEALAKRLRSA